jgi:hypothetical protein
MIRNLTFGCTIPLGPADAVFRYAILAEREEYDAVWLPERAQNVGHIKRQR